MHKVYNGRLSTGLTIDIEEWGDGEGRMTIAGTDVDQRPFLVVIRMQQLQEALEGYAASGQSENYDLSAVARRLENLPY